MKNSMNSNRNSRRKDCLIMVLTIVNITLVAIVLCGSLMRVLEGRLLFQLFVAVLLSVSATGIITTLLLYSQRIQHEKWVRAQMVFLEEQIRDQRLFESKQKQKEKEKLWEFLRKLCDMVKDQKILPEYIYKELYNE
ncbi:hypothetical protein [Prevotella sp. khp1]|uniref:hypothetical protein n=2 Tax=Prevotellaceae TaxID=171552 RepID=UPI000B80DC4C|nr:hypothetical protein [Prevotella sp. khp1]